MADKDYDRGHKDGEARANGEISTVEEMGGDIALPFVAAIVPDYVAGYKDRMKGDGKK